MVIRPLSTPKASSSTLTIGTKQLVVHEALDTTLCLAGSNVSSLTPGTNVASAPLDGAETMTKGAPASRCIAACSRLEKMPVDSTTTSTPRSPHGSSLGSRSASTLKLSPPILMPSSATWTSSSIRPNTESYRSRWAIVSTEPMSLTATMSMSAPIFRAARKKLRPMRPKPLIPTRMDIGTGPFSSLSSLSSLSLPSSASTLARNHHHPNLPQLATPWQR